MLNHIDYNTGQVPGMVVNLALERARTLARAGRPQEAARALQTAARQFPERQDVYLLRAECFVAMGHLEEAERDFRWARRVGPDNGAIGGRIAVIAQQRQAHTEAAMARRSLHGFKVLEFLGCGWEGAVYLCTDRRGARFIVKQFHPHRVEKINNAIEWLRRPVPSFRTRIIELGQALQTAPHPLFFAYEGAVANGRLEALYYPYRRLYPIERDQLRNATLRRALVRAALSGQAHLLDRMGMVMSDLRAGQFMLDSVGRVRYVDYGASILPVTDFRIEEDRLHVLTLILLLVEVFAWEEWRAFSDPRLAHASPEVLQRHIDESPGLQRGLSEVPSLAHFIGPGAVLDGKNFDDAAAYRRAAAAIPAATPIKVLSRSVGWELRRGVRRIRRNLRRA